MGLGGMRKIAFLLVLTMGIASPALAAKRVNVAELEQLLTAVQGQTDSKVAKQLSGLELTERASGERLARWEAKFPGHHCHDALTILADASVFLDLPAAEIPDVAPPDNDAQKAMLMKVANYLDTTIPRLPNFYATRKTQHFEDTPPNETMERVDMASGNRATRGGGLPSMTPAESEYVPLHATSKSSAIVSYLDGHEMRGKKRADSDLHFQPSQELSSYGEFGPILLVVLGNPKKHQITWGHWEQNSSGVQAVFHYSVPQGQSGYMSCWRTASRLRSTYPRTTASSPLTLPTETFCASQ